MRPHVFELPDVPGQRPRVVPFALNITGPSTAVLLWAGPKRDMAGALQAAEPLFHLPSPRIGSTRAKDSLDMQQGYFLQGWDGVEALLQATNASGLAYVGLLGWEKSSGHYQVNEKSFPGGDDGLKATVAKLHKAGVKVGMHFLSDLISMTDSYLTPVPHPDLAIDAALPLASAISATASFIPTAGVPTSSPWLATRWNAPVASGVVGTGYDFSTGLVRIGDELVTYTGVNISGLFGVVRGAKGSKAAAHLAASNVSHFAQMYDMVMPRPGSELQANISARLAHVYNYCEMDMVYFDGSEGLAAMGSEQIPISMMELDFFSRLTRDVLIEGSSIVPYNWWLNARANTGD